MKRSTINHYHVPATAETVHWGYFSKSLKPLVEVESGDFVTIETLTHHANDDAGAHGEGRSRRRERLLLGQDAQGREPPRRRTDGRVAVRARRRRGLRRAHLHRPGGGQGRRGRRHPRGAHPRRAPAAVRQCRVQGQELRQQRGGVVGLSLQRPDRGAEEARGHHDLRGGRQRRARLGQGAVQLPLDAADRSVRRGAQDHRLSRACRSTTARSRRTGAC